MVSKGNVGLLADKIFGLWNINDFEYDLEYDNTIKLNFHVERDAGPEVDFIIIENEICIELGVTKMSATLILSLFRDDPGRPVFADFSDGNSGVVFLYIQYEYIMCWYTWQ